MSAGYVELHAKSFYSFGLGASHTHELLAQAREYGYDALSLTDTNLCGALEFARLAGSLGIQPITGGELTLADGSRLVAAGPHPAKATPTSPASSPWPTPQTAASRSSTTGSCPSTPPESPYSPAAGVARLTGC